MRHVVMQRVTRLSRALAVLALCAMASVLPSVASAQDHESKFAGAMPDTGGIDAKFDPRVVEITRGLACNCGTCPHEPVSTCTCGTAARLRADVAGMVSKGQEKDAIVAAMVAKYSETILPKPPFEGLALVAYLGPFLAIAGVGTWLWFTIRKLSRKAVTDATTAAKTGSAAPPAADDPYLAAIDRELSRREL